jgi:hypothetical protein
MPSLAGSCALAAGCSAAGQTEGVVITLVYILARVRYDAFLCALFHMFYPSSQSSHPHTDMTVWRDDHPLLHLPPAMPRTAAVLRYTGVILGLSPLAPLLVDASAAEAFLASHAGAGLAALELRVLLGTARTAWEMLEMLAGATLALQAIVLAASLFGPREDDAAAGNSSSGGSGDVEETAAAAAAAAAESDLDIAANSSSSSSSGNEVEVEYAGGGSSSPGAGGGLTDASRHPPAADMMQRVPPLVRPAVGLTLLRQQARTPDEASSSVLDALRPRAPWEWRALVAIAAVRFLLLPAATTAAVLIAQGAGLLPADPAITFVLLLQSVQPPAQNLTLMVALQPGVAHLGPPAARLLLQLYALGVLPVTLWVSVFAKLTLL